MRLYKFIFSVFLVINNLCYSQTILLNFNFVDKYGNSYQIDNIKKCPSFMDTTFFKNELPKVLNVDSLKKKTSYNISSLKKIKFRKVYELKIGTIPLTTNSMQELIEKSGFSNYRIFLKKISKNKYEIASLKYIGSDI